MCGIPCAVRLMVALAASALAGAVSASAIAITPVHPLTGRTVLQDSHWARRPDCPRLVRVDYTLFKDVNGLSGTQPFDTLFKFAAGDLTYVILAIVALTFLIPWRVGRAERRRGAVAATVSAAVALLLVIPISHLVDRV